MQSRLIVPAAAPAKPWRAPMLLQSLSDPQVVMLLTALHCPGGRPAAPSAPAVSAEAPLSGCAEAPGDASCLKVSGVVVHGDSRTRPYPMVSCIVDKDGAQNWREFTGTVELCGKR